MKSMTFKEKVRGIVSRIPKGRVMTYGAVAKKAGSPNAARAVGSIMKANYDTGVPCHRVVRSDGFIGDYNRGGASAKEKKLRAEGVLVQNHKVRLS